MDYAPITGAWLLAPLAALVPVAAVVAVFLVPSLRSRRWIVWSVLGIAVAAALGALIWTYTV